MRARQIQVRQGDWGGPGEDAACSLRWMSRFTSHMGDMGTTCARRKNLQSHASLRTAEYFCVVSFPPSSCFVRAFAQTCAPNQNQSARWSYSRASSHWSLLVQDRCASVQAKGLRRNPGDARDALPGDWRRSRRDQMAPGAHARRRGTGANRSFSWNELFIAPWLLWIHCAGDHNCCLVRTNIQKATARGGDESSFRNSLCSWGLKCQQKPSTEVLFFSLCFSFCY